MKRTYVHFLILLPIIALISVIWINSAGKFAEQWTWLAKSYILFIICNIYFLIINYRNRNIANIYYSCIIWVLIIIGGSQVIYGLLQLYCHVPSNHPLFGLTGSFLNPGPYSGYLATVFPLCLNEWLHLNDKMDKNITEKTAYYLTGIITLLILCILLVGMSRSSWLAASISGLWIYSIHYSFGKKISIIWRHQPQKVISISVFVFTCLIIGGIFIFNFKKDSACGRLFIWKITCIAIAERPITGYGMNSFARAYGMAQENYFANEPYSPSEELVAGSPEYAFNEYLQLILERGIVCSLVIILLIFFCLHKGVKKKRLSACGGVMSLLIFAFSSYPMQIPAFVITFFLLLTACIIEYSRITLAVLILLVGFAGGILWKNDISEKRTEWANTQLFYKNGAYITAKKSYQELYPTLKNRGNFLFEYGHCLHKLKEYDTSIKILKEAEKLSCDPMILNIIGKNF